MALENELEFYLKNKEGWLKEHRGHFVVIKNSDLIGFYQDHNSAMEAGIDKFGLEPFMVREVKYVEDPPMYIPFICTAINNPHDTDLVPA